MKGKLHSGSGPDMVEHVGGGGGGGDGGGGGGGAEAPEICVLVTTRKGKK